MPNRPTPAVDAELILETAGGLTGIPGGALLGKLIARTGRSVLGGFITTPKGKREISIQEEHDTPPFLVVGMGRCGCHVAAELAAISWEHRSASQSRVRKQSKHFFEKINIFRGKGRKGRDVTFGFNPLFFLGDYDGASFGEINGLMERSGVPQSVIDGVVRLSFDPIATGGVGNVPVLADFLTKALIAAPVAKDPDSGALPAWNQARAFLTNDFYSRRSNGATCN